MIEESSPYAKRNQYSVVKKGHILAKITSTKDEEITCQNETEADYPKRQTI